MKKDPLGLFSSKWSFYYIVLPVSYSLKYFKGKFTKVCVLMKHNIGACIFLPFTVLAI